MVSQHTGTDGVSDEERIDMKGECNVREQSADDDRKKARLCHALELSELAVDDSHRSEYDT
jgi:hypothetical protein